MSVGWRLAAIVAVLTGCNPVAAPPAPAAPGGSAPAEAKDDAFGGLSRGGSEAAVLKALGPPGNKSKAVVEGATGLVLSTWSWPAKGVELVMDTTDKAPPRLHEIRLSAPSSLKNAKGIGIGSKRAEVVAAYRSRISAESSGPDRIVVGSIYDGVMFDLKGDVVVGIFVGASAE